MPLKPTAFIDRKRLATMFSTFQPVRPERIADAIRRHVPREKAGIVEWFEEGEFDERFLQGKPPLKRARPSDPHARGRMGSSPTSRMVRYWVYGERVCEPRHSRLQAQFVEHLKTLGHRAEPGLHAVDVRYEDEGCPVFVEVKPTEVVGPQFAIRAAVGQLLEYRYRFNPDARLEIVISEAVAGEPIDEWIAFLRSLRIGLWRRTPTGFERVA